METRIRRTLSMVSRVRDFARTHPSDDPGAAGVANTLDERLDRANALLTQQLAGQLEAHAAAVHRRELRRAIATELLPQLVRVGKALARERPELAGKFVGPPDKADLKLFTVMAKALLAEGQVEREALVSHGLLTTLLDDLGTALAEFDSVTEASHASRTAHVGARADLRRVSAELTRLVGILDGQNRQRFRRDPELKAAWRSARNVVGPFRSKPEPESPQDAASQDTAPQRRNARRRRVAQAPHPDAGPAVPAGPWAAPPRAPRVGKPFCRAWIAIACIARYWSGRVRARDTEEYLAYVVVLSFWESLDALREFAGADPEVAVFYPEDERFLVAADQTVSHFEIPVHQAAAGLWT